MMIPMADRLVAARVAFEAADMLIDSSEVVVWWRKTMITTFFLGAILGKLN